MFSKKNYTNENFEDWVFYNSGAREQKFEFCNFSFSLWEDAYFNNCTFLNCKFIGTRFKLSIIKDCEFRGCSFEYAQFWQTELSGNSIQYILRNLPDWQNVRRKLCRNLRTNAETLNDKDSVGKILKEEILSSKEHYMGALYGTSEYYQRKWPSFFSKISVIKEIGWIYLLGMLWGHGEKPWRILINVFILLIISGTFVSWSNNEAFCLDSFFDSFCLSLRYFLGLGASEAEESLSVPNFWQIFLVVCRYVFIGLFLSAIIHKTRWR